LLEERVEACRQLTSAFSGSSSFVAQGQSFA